MCVYVCFRVFVIVFSVVIFMSHFSTHVITQCCDIPSSIHTDQFCTCIFCVLYDSHSFSQFICLLYMLAGCKLSEDDRNMLES
jgi:hypothetical protein